MHAPTLNHVSTSICYLTSLVRSASPCIHTDQVRQRLKKKQPENKTLQN
uniref:Uncharacterized protein n=1 Tax=Arundo donax TaxID=35708 RepID=A0A0A9EUY7_ARUDO